MSETNPSAVSTATFLASFLDAALPPVAITFISIADPSVTVTAAPSDPRVVDFAKASPDGLYASLEGKHAPGFVLTFDAPAGAAPTSLPPLKPSFVLEHLDHDGKPDGSKALVYLATGDADAIAALRKDLDPLDGDYYTIGTDMPLPFGDWALDDAGAALLETEERFEVYDFSDLEEGFFPDDAGESESSAEESEGSLRARLIDKLQNGNPNPMQTGALKYAARGFYPIPVNGIVKKKKSKERECLCQEGKRFRAEKSRKPVEACPSPGKHPTVEGWEDRNSSRDPDVLMHTFAPKYNKQRTGVDEGLNIGFVTGPDTGLVVLDIDGPEGLANLTKIVEEYGSLPETIRVNTGSGGRHIYFRSPDGITILNSMSKIAPKVDFRGEHGFVVAPRSKHISGGSYSFEDGHSPDDLPLAEMPEWLVKLASEGGEKEAAGKPGKGNRSSAGSKKGARKEPGASFNTGGWQGYLAEVGDHEGGRGFNGPIGEAMCSYFRENGADADEAEFLEALGETFAKADKSKGGRDKYQPDSTYISDQLESARQKIRDTPGDQYPITVDEEGWITLDDDNPKYCIAQHEGRDWIHTVEWKRDDDGNFTRETGSACCPQFKLVSHADDKSRTSATVTIAFETRHNGWKQITFQKDAPYERNAFLGMLARVSFPVESEADTITFFKLLDFPTDTLLVDRTGWHDGALLHPSGAVLAARAASENADAPKKLRLRGDAPVGDWRAGKLDGWKAAVAPAFANGAHGREQFALGVMAGCAGIVAGFVGMAGFPLLNLHGNTSRGKSTSLMLAASASGAPHQKGAYHSLRKTDNGMESILAARSGITVAFDEGKTTNAETLDNIIWMMAHGVGKTRATVTGEARVEKEFCGFAMTANEVPLGQMMTQAKKSQPGGFYARVCDVDVSSVPELTGEVRDSFFASIGGIKEHSGHAWEPVARHLQSVGVEHVASELDRLAKELAGPDADAFTTRSATALALVWYSGIVMQELGLIPPCDLARVVRWAWGTRAVESTVDPFTRAMETLSSNVALRRGIDIYEWDEAQTITVATDYDGNKETVIKKPQRYREAAAFIYMSGLDELLLVPRDKLADLCGGHMSGGMIRSQMAAREMLALSGKRDPKPRWSKLPDEQPVSHYRIKLSELSKFAGG